MGRQGMQGLHSTMSKIKLRTKVDKAYWNSESRREGEWNRNQYE